MLKKLKFAHIVWALFYIFVFVFLLQNSFGYMDPDLGWHLQVGKQISIDKDVPRVDLYDYPLEGKKWIDHEWSINLLMYLIYDNFGYNALTIFFAFLMIVILFIFNNHVLKYHLKNKSNYIPLIFCEAFALFGMAPHLGVRVQEFTILYILLLLIIFDVYDKRRRTKDLIWLPILFFFWANTHAGFIMGYFLLFAWIGTKIFVHIINKINFFTLTDKTIGKKEYINFISFSILSILVTFINPYFTELQTYLSECFSNPYYLTRIAEWQPIFYWPIFGSQLFYTAFIFSIMIILLAFNVDIKNRKITINFWYFALSFLFLLFTIKSKRNFPLFFIISFPVVIASIDGFIDLPKKILDFLKNNIFIKFFFLSGILLVIIFFTARIKFSGDPFSYELYCYTYPCESITYLKKHPELHNKNILNDYTWGGFLIWNLPEKKLFIDGRLPQYEINDSSMLEEYYAFYDKDEIENQINKYNIELFFLRKPQKITYSWLEKLILGFDINEEEPKIDELRKYLDDSSEWEMVYENINSDIYVKQ